MADELMFTVEGSQAAAATPISLAEAGLRERQDLQEWVVAHPEILGPGVLVITFEFDRWWSSNGTQPHDRLDVLGLDESGRLVVAELKRDRAPDTVEMQAVKYAAMVSRFTPEALAVQFSQMLSARGEPCSEEDALERLIDHAEDLSPETLRRPRIVLLAAEYPPVVTATVVWLNEMGIDVNLVRYQAYRTQQETLLAVSQLYPVRDVEDFTVSPRQAEVRAVEETKRRTKDGGTVRRLVDGDVIPDGAALRLRPSLGVSGEVRAMIDDWAAEDQRHGEVTWRNMPGKPLVWALDGEAYSPSGLAKEVIRRASGVERGVQGTKWWVDEEGNDLVQLSARHLTGKKKQYLDFWTRFLARLREEHPDWSKAQVPQPDSWFNMPSPIPGTHFSVSFPSGKRLRSELYVDEGNADRNLQLFDSLKEQRTRIESAFGRTLEWEELPSRQACRIADYAKGDVDSVDEYNSFIDWFFDSSQRWRKALEATSPAVMSSRERSPSGHPR